MTTSFGSSATTKIDGMRPGLPAQKQSSYAEDAPLRGPNRKVGPMACSIHKVPLIIKTEARIPADIQARSSKAVTTK